jgi:hypothetical protein
MINAYFDKLAGVVINLIIVSALQLKFKSIRLKTTRILNLYLLVTLTSMTDDF